VRAGAAAALVTLVALGVSARASAQPDTSSRSLSPRFLTDYSFHLNGAYLGTGDPAFDWDADFGGDVDFLDYGAGRINLLASYRVTLGNELRPFDANQGQYDLEAAGTYRLRKTEIAGVLHHISRHLSDRFKQDATNWNMLGARVKRPFEVRGWHVDGRAWLLGVYERSQVDYRASIGVQADGLRRVSQRWSALLAAAVGIIPVDPAVAGRQAQTGFRFETGARVEGQVGALELYAAIERRVDADLQVPGARTWSMLGFRLVNR
jgi:hypothetical protein